MKYSKIRPISDLRDTNEISRLCHESNEPIFVTRNGYSDLVIMSDECFRTYDVKSIAKSSDSTRLRYINRPVDEKNNGFVRISTHPIPVKVGDISSNLETIKKQLDEDIKKQVDISLFPELSLTAYTCSDLFFNRTILNKIEESLIELAHYGKNSKLLYAVGAPFVFQEKLFNCAFIFSQGKLLGIVPKSYLPNYDEFYEKRHFQEALDENIITCFDSYEVKFGSKLLFQDVNRPSLIIGVEICEDLWAPISPSSHHVLNGATVILNLSASNETLYKDEYRFNLIKTFSHRGLCVYAYVSSYDESTTDLVYSGRSFIAEAGEILKENNLFDKTGLMIDVDLERISFKRLKDTTFHAHFNPSYDIISFECENTQKDIIRDFSVTPFINYSIFERQTDSSKAILLQAQGLAKRLRHIGLYKIVIGLSGGLDSTLALLVAYECMKILKTSTSNIFAFSLPAQGTSNRTKNNARDLATKLGVSFEEINIVASVESHLKDLKHDGLTPDVTFENAQARERTQFLFDKANLLNAIVIGTGDLSELALGYCTYNGDHMSNYAVNASLPKTLIQSIVKDYAGKHPALMSILQDIILTPISPELLPTDETKTTQFTEDIVGPYELHDFFLYHFILDGYSFYKIGLIAIKTFRDKYIPSTIIKWLRVFVKRFYSQQFKRSAVPDGVKVSPVSLSPRGDWRMPSDASSCDALKDIDRLEKEFLES